MKKEIKKGESWRRGFVQGYNEAKKEAMNKLKNSLDKCEYCNKIVDKTNKSNNPLTS